MLVGGRDMSLENFEGNTFVAFVDISGFTKKVIKRVNDAMSTLGYFYNVGYQLLGNYSQDISGIFVSDCAILYVHNKELEKTIKIERLLEIVSKINKKCIDNDIMLTTNISYGYFKYEEKIELKNMQKSSFAGNAYLNAYIDSTKKMKVCYCRILGDDTSDILNFINQKYITKVEKKYCYFWWQCNSNNEMSNYIDDYKKIEKKYKGDEKFKKICNLTKRYSNATE